MSDVQSLVVNLAMAQSQIEDRTSVAVFALKKAVQTQEQTISTLLPTADPGGYASNGQLVAPPPEIGVNLDTLA